MAGEAGASIQCDRYGFFNGILGLEQANWAQYWKGIIPDGVLAPLTYNENDPTEYMQHPLHVTVSEGEMAGQVVVQEGEAMVDNHHIWLTNSRTLTLTPKANSAKERWDLVVIRVTYSNSGTSTAELAVVEGAEINANGGSTNSLKNPVQNTGGTYELPLAAVRWQANTNMIHTADIVDKRFVYKLGHDSVFEFTGTSITCYNDIEYRNKNSINTLTINLPNNPTNIFITGVNFTTSGQWNNNNNGLTIMKGSTDITNSIKAVGDSFRMKSKRYNMVIWWDSGYNNYWCVAKAV